MLFDMRLRSDLTSKNHVKKITIYLPFQYVAFPQAHSFVLSKYRQGSWLLLHLKSDMIIAILNYTSCGLFWIRNPTSELGAYPKDIMPYFIRIVLTLEPVLVCAFSDDQNLSLKGKLQSHMSLISLFFSPKEKKNTNDGIVVDQHSLVLYTR